jgi:hypothetical protein
MTAKQAVLDLQKGDVVEVLNLDDPRGEPVSAQVQLVSPNGRSLGLMMDGGMRAGDGIQIGVLPLLLEDDGFYRNIVSNDRVLVTMHTAAAMG